MLKKIIVLLLSAVLALSAAACSSADEEEIDELTVESNWEYLDDPNQEEETYMDPGWPEDDAEEESVLLNEQIVMNVMIDGIPVMVDWEKNEAVYGLYQLVSKDPLSVKMSGFGGFEQVGSLGTHLTRSDREINAQPGDIVLYSGNRIVVFYGQNTWSYTPLGSILGLTDSELNELLGNGDVQMVISAG